MKLRNLTQSVLVALLVASPLVGAETQYPAADFQPEIIKQDAELIKQHAEAAKSAAQQPAATAKPAPAANTESKPTIKTEQPKPTVTAAAPKTEESSNLTIILVALGAAGAAFWFTRQRKPAGAGAQPVATAPAAAGTTGVAKYISNLPETIGGNTGVARYISALPEVTQETGVSKYVKSLAATESPYQAPPKPATGVEKYLKSLPEAPKVLGETGVARYLKDQNLAA